MTVGEGVALARVEGGGEIQMVEHCLSGFNHIKA